MKKTLISAAILAVASVSSAFAGSHSDTVVVEFGYPYPHLFDVTYEEWKRVNHGSKFFKRRPSF